MTKKDLAVLSYLQANGQKHIPAQVSQICLTFYAPAKNLEIKGVNS